MIGGYAQGRPPADVLQELCGSGALVALSSNENPLGASPRAVAALLSSAVHVYPDAGADALRKRLAAEHGVDPAQIAVGPGTTDLIYHLVRLCGGEVLAPPTTFLAYRLAARVAGMPYREGPLEPGPETRLVCLANPGNPTGQLHPQQELSDLLQRVPRAVTVVLDEAYREYLDEETAPDGIALVRSHPNVVVLRTFSKAHGLAALRVGYAVGSVERIEALDAVRPPFSVTGPAQAAAMAALDDPEHVRASRLLVDRGRLQLRDGLASLGLHVPEGHGNFLLVRVGPRASAVWEALARGGVLVRRMDPYGLTEHLRVTIGTADQNQRLLELLGQLV